MRVLVVIPAWKKWPTGVWGITELLGKAEARCLGSSRKNSLTLTFGTDAQVLD